MRTCLRRSIGGRSKGRGGFTLIELLVVMSIIMVLASMLFPSFARAKGTAMQISCASNLRQCGMALTMYRNDNDEEYPPQDLSVLSGIGNAPPRWLTGPENTIWVGQLYRYVSDKRVMRCRTADRGKVDALNGMSVGVGINVQLTCLTMPGDVLRGPTVRSDAESTTIAMADSAVLTFENTADGIMDVAYANAASGTYNAGDVGGEHHFRHVGGSNILFADCHVKTYTPQRLFSEVPPPN